MTEPIISAHEFDFLFDNGMNTTPFDDWSTVKDDERFTSEQAVTLKMPRWLWIELAGEADSRGVSFDELLTMWLADRVKEERNREAQTMVAIALEDPDRMKQWIDARVREVRESEEAAFAHARETMTPQDVAPLLPVNEPDLQRA